MKRYLSICTAKEGITCSFDNGQILDYQDNFKYLGDVSFTVYFDFETTSRHAVFFDTVMYAVSYCQIYTFHPELNLGKIVTYRSFQQKPQEIYDLSHFKSEHVPFFDKVTLRQLKDAASAVLSREKSTSLAELFSNKLKFTIDTLKYWFNRIIKLKFFEVDSFMKIDWRKKKSSDQRN